MIATLVTIVVLLAICMGALVMMALDERVARRTAERTLAELLMQREAPMPQVLVSGTCFGTMQAEPMKRGYVLRLRGPAVLQVWAVRGDVQLTHTIQSVDDHPAERAIGQA